MKQIPGCMKSALMSQCLLHGCVSYSRGGKNQGQCETGANATLFLFVAFFCTEEIECSLCEVLSMIFDTYFGVIPHRSPEFSISHEKLDTESQCNEEILSIQRPCDTDTFSASWRAGKEAVRTVRCKTFKTSLHFAHHFSAFCSPFTNTFHWAGLGWYILTFFPPFSGGISH